MIYFNNAATTYPKPKEVILAVGNYLETIPFDNYRTGLSTNDGDVIGLCRKKISELINVPDHNRIIFTSGATESLNLAIKGLFLKDAHIISTILEHNSVIRPLKHLEQSYNTETSFVPPEQIERSIKSNTRLIVINHASNVTGDIVNIELVSKIARQHGILLLVDASQTIGSINIDMQKLKIDMLAFTGHKSLFSMPGVGCLYISENIDLIPLKTGGTGIKSESLYQPKTMPLYYEAGTHNTPAIVSLNAGLDYIKKTGMDIITHQKNELRNDFVSKIVAIPNIKIHNLVDNEFLSKDKLATCSFNIEGKKPGDIGYILETSFNIILRSGLHCAPLIHKYIGTEPYGSLRVSFSSFNKREEVDVLMSALYKIAS